MQRSHIRWGRPSWGVEGIANDEDGGCFETTDLTDGEESGAFHIDGLNIFGLILRSLFTRFAIRGIRAPGGADNRSEVALGERVRELRDERSGSINRLGGRKVV